MSDYRVGLAPVERELTARELSVEGRLPDWLEGWLLRNGPGRFSVGERSLNHWFDGLALLRGFRLQGAEDRVEASVRFLRSETYRRAQDGILAAGQFGTAADGGRLSRALGLLRGRVTDNASVSIARADGRTIALTETTQGVAFDPVTLQTMTTVERARGLDVTTVLGHPHYDPDNDDLLNLGVALGRRSEYVLYRQPRTAGPATPIGRVPVDRPAYVHSFGLARDHAVITEHPLRVRPRRLLTAETFIDAYRWHPEEGTRFLVLDRYTGERVAEATVPPFFVFHHVNAFETGDAVVVDLLAFPDRTAIDGLYLENLRSANPTLAGAELRRYRLPLDGGAAAWETLDPGPLEFPVIDYPRRQGERHRVVFAVGNRERPPAELANQLVKLDLETGSRTVWRDPGVYPGEPLLVTPPDAGPEAGVVCSVVLDAEADRSALVVLDAANMEERARATLPIRLPLGFHGQFYREPGVSPRSMP